MGSDRSVTGLPTPLVVERRDVLYGETDQYAAFPNIIRTDREIVVKFETQDLQALRSASVRHPHYRPVAQPVWIVSTNRAASWAIATNAPTIGNVLDNTFGGSLPDGSLFDMTWHYIKGTTTRSPFYLNIYQGSLGQPVWSEHLPAFDRIYLHGMSRLPDGRYLACAYSRDGVTAYQGSVDGKQWQPISHIHHPTEEPFDFSEAGIAVYDDGRVVLVLRADWSRKRDPEEKFKPEAPRLYQVESTDFGKTWSRPRQLPIRGQPAFLLKLRSGNLLMVYGHRSAPYSVRALLSHDRGRTWNLQSELILHTFEPGGWDIGYPVATQLEDGRILVAYYGYLTAATELDSPHGIFASLIRESGND
ncbi:MAG TPA: exo-alpha-sialidase [Verrucomicrobia bacterium]|nr:exo-alpha-sialidase [Verrucomicrobiota bacterium]HOB33153.1 sialidase family protein [Verrucomicrobiota bacterium]HOP96633.1 sialidase family protein [Verrucomicrobiota bacterium]